MIATLGINIKWKQTSFSLGMFFFYWPKTVNDILFLIFFAIGQNALLCLPLSAPSSGPEGADAVGLGEARGGLGWTIQAMSERPVLRSDY